jgi:hypothetical protein
VAPSPNDPGSAHCRPIADGEPYRAMGALSKKRDEHIGREAAQSRPTAIAG